MAIPTNTTAVENTKPPPLPFSTSLLASGSRRVKMIIAAILDKQHTIDALQNGSLEFHFGEETVKMKFAGQSVLST